MTGTLRSGGRNRKSGNLRILEGSWPRTERKPLPGDPPDMPPWLGPKEQEVWSRLVPNLQSLRRADGELLARLCQASSAATRAWAQLGGAVTATTADGNPKTHPAWGVWRDSVNLVYRLSAVFGLSPADRERLFGSLPDDDPDDDILD
jgi:P27 family predicted phage terminase small subunit